MTLLMSTSAIAHHHSEEGEFLKKGVSNTSVTNIAEIVNGSLEGEL
jgi:hypothetical protein